VPDEIVGNLVSCKFLVRSGDKIFFRHDLVRAFFASIYFRHIWKADLNLDGETIDRNWTPMLQFFVAQHDVNPAEASRLLFWLLERNREVAADLFKSIRRDHKQLLSSSTEESFCKRFGEASLLASEVPEKS
jgi:hypothetical protein